MWNVLLTRNDGLRQERVYCSHNVTVFKKGLLSFDFAALGKRLNHGN
jgi:hypothetical protein